MKLVTRRTIFHSALLMVCLWVFFKFLVPALLPLVLGVILAFVLEPLVRYLSGLGIGRGASSLIAVLLILSLLFFVLSFSVTRIGIELGDLYAELPKHRDEFNRVVAQIVRVAGDISQQLPEPIARALQDQWNRLADLLAALVTGAGGLVKGVPRFSALTVFTFFSAYFVLRDRESIEAFLGSLVPSESKNSFQRMETDILGGVAGFIRAQLALVLLTMMVNVIGLTLMGINYAVAVGLLLAVLDLLPVVGPGLVYVPWILYHVLSGSPGIAVGLGILYGGVSILRQIAQTHLVGREMGLHPLVTLTSLYIGFRIFGPMGLVYGPLSAIIIKTMWLVGFIPHEGGD